MEEEKKDYHTKAIDEAKKWEALYQQFVQELKTEDRYQTYFSQFAPASVEQFISYYASRKVSWYRYGDSNSNYGKRKVEQWYKMAVPLFVSIQRKKVIEVLWRWANYKLAVPEARSFRDFNKWLCNPFVCPYISAAQPYEVDIAVRFLQSLDDRERFMYLHHEYYDINGILILGMEEIELDDHDYPLFFRFWDDEFNTPLVRKTPERIQKERHYIETYREYKKQLEPPKPKPQPKTGKPALAHWDRKIMDAFVLACEPAEYQRMYQLLKWWARNSFSEMAEREMEYLSNSPKHLPIESNDDWRQAIAQTAEQYTRERVVYYLPVVYQEYEKRLAAGDIFSDWVKKKDYTEGNAWYANYLQELLEGRKLMNEPADFNF